MADKNFIKDLENCINLHWYDIPEKIQNEIDKVYAKYLKKEDPAIIREFKKLDRILDKEWNKWVKADSGGAWFEIESEIMTGHMYSLTDDCEWIKHMNGKIYYFGQF